MAEKRCYYEILSVTREADDVLIKKSYKKLATKYHPDRNPGDDDAVASFKEAAEAYEVLSNPQKRQTYDRYGHEGLSGAGGRAGAGFSDVSDIFDVFGDLFEGFGFGGSSRRRRGGARQGESIQTDLKITLLEAAEGCERTIEVHRRELCETCSGSGAKPGSSPVGCDYCGGHGQVVQSQGFFRMQTTCPSCKGAGTVIRDKCSECRGTGRVATELKLDVKVPPGVDTGMQLCLRGEGEPGLGGGGRGDLYVELYVEEHSLFQREGSELTCHVPVTYTQAALGAEIEIPVLEGRHEQTIPAGTQPGDVIRIPGGGMPDPRTGRRGNLNVVVQVEIPRKLDEPQEELLRQLAELEHANVSPHRSSFLKTLKDWFTAGDDAPD